MLKLIQEISLGLNFPIYLVGGVVRDLILGISSEDFDFAVVGDSQKVAEELAKRLQVDVKYNPTYLAATVLAEPRIDLVSTRFETYSHPGASPICNQVDLLKDLTRRDFTINAMAISIQDYINNNVAGVIDPLNGKEDLNNKLLRIIHDQSFFDDPARIIRMLRYKNRYQLELDQHTSELLDIALKFNVFSFLPNYRMESELIKVVDEKAYPIIFVILSKYNLFDCKDLDLLERSLIKLQQFNLEKKIIWKLIKYIICYLSETNNFMNKIGYKDERIEEIKSQINLILKAEKSQIMEEDILYQCLQ